MFANGIALLVAAALKEGTQGLPAAVGTLLVSAGAYGWSDE
jgi:hypothetical protein